MTHLNSELYPDDPNLLPPARRRRARRLLTPLEADARTAYLDNLAHRGAPTFDFYLFSALCAGILAIALILDSPAIILVGILVAPLMAPLFGLALSIVTGSKTSFVRNLFGFLTGSIIAFIVGTTLGFIYRLFGIDPSAVVMTQALYHCQFSLIHGLVLTFASVWLSAAMLKDEYYPRIPSLALAYELFLPLIASGIGLGLGIPSLWPAGLVVFAVHMSWATLVGMVMLMFMGFRPLTIFGYTVGGAFTLLGIILLIGFGSAGMILTQGVGLPTPVPSATSTVTITPTPTFTPAPPSITPTSTRTPSPSATFTITPIPSPTPYYAMIVVPGSSGAYLRKEPGGEIVKSYLNGTLVEILPEVEMLEGVIWILVRAPDGIQGWMVQALLTTPMPTPGE